MPCKQLPRAPLIQTAEDDDDFGFDDLESLLDEPTSIPPGGDGVPAAEPDDGFEELENLLEDDSAISTGAIARCYPGFCRGYRPRTKRS